MAPEQAAGRVHEIGPATDLFTLGVVLYLMLTGNYPFKQMGGMPAFHRPPSPPSQLVPGLPAGIDELLADMLTINPQHRARHANAVAHALRSLAPELPPVGSADGAQQSPPPGAAVVHVPTAATEVPAGARIGLSAREGLAVQAQQDVVVPATGAALHPEAPTLQPIPAVKPPPDLDDAPQVIRSGPEVIKAAAPAISLKELSLITKGPSPWTSQIIRIKKVERSSSVMPAVSPDKPRKDAHRDDDAPRHHRGGWTYAILGVILTALAVVAIFYVAMR
jgi:serine/threonine-protein kinase